MNKKILIPILKLALFFCISSYFTFPANAAVPEIRIKVVNSVTNADITNVYVQLTNSSNSTYWRPNCTLPPPYISKRYELIDSNTKYASFINTELEIINNRTSKYDTMVDLDFDGTNDNTLNSEITCLEGPSYPADFGCGAAPLKVDIIKPVGWTGSFSSLLLPLQNIGGVLERTLYYYPPGAEPSANPTSSAPNPTYSGVNCLNNSTCGSIEAGKLTLLGNLTTSNINVNDTDVYLKVTVNPFNDDDRVARFFLNLDTNYFQFIDPLATTKTYISESNGTNSTQIYSDQGLQLSYDPLTPSLFSVVLPDFNYGFKYTTYIKILPIQSTGLSGQATLIPNGVNPINFVQYSGHVNNAFSEYEKQALSSPILVVGNAAPSTPPVSGNYFNTKGGNIFSRGTVSESIHNILPPTESLISSNSGILFSQSTNNLGRNTESTVSFFDENYSVLSNQSYSELYSNFQNQIVDRDLSLQNVSIPSGIYRHQGGDLVIHGNTPFKQIDSGTNITVFVDGDLYFSPISSSDSVLVNADGKSFVSYIVRGNIGIDPSINKIQGLFIADGRFDTVCDHSTNSFINNECEPLTYASTSSLEIDGMVIANSGFNLQRNNSTGSSGEIFTIRPDFFISSHKALASKQTSWFESNQ